MLEGPFKNETITESTAFLWTEIGAPGPGGAVGAWDWFPNIGALAGFIRFVILPSFFGIWLVREEWDEREDYIRAEELFNRARESGKCRYAQDIPLMEKIIEGMDRVLKSSELQLVENIKTALQAFNDKWNYTQTWKFFIYIFANPAEVGQELYERDPDRIEEELELTKEDWIKVCNNVLKNEEDMKTFIKELEESNLC